MASTGAVFPTLAESVAEAPWSDNGWTSPANVVSDDGATAIVNAASYDSGDQTFVLKAYGFDFSAIPVGATIDGVICVANAYWSAGGASLDLMQLLDTSRAKVGTNQCSTAVVLTSSTTNTVTKGSSTDLWGNALTVDWVKNSNFGVALGCLATTANVDVEIDYVTLEVFYTAAASSPITGSTSGSTTVSSSITARGILTGVTAGASSINSSLGGKGSLSAATTGISSISSILQGKGSLSGAVAGIASVIGELRDQLTTSLITGATSGLATVSAIIRGIGSLTGALTGTSTNSSTLRGKGVLTGAVITTSSSSGTIYGKGSLSGSIDGNTTLTAVFVGAIVNIKRQLLGKFGIRI